MREEATSLIQKHPTESLPFKAKNIIIISKTSLWEQFLSEALLALESTLMIGTVTLVHPHFSSQHVGLLHVKTLLVNALEHSEQPWVVLEVLALVTYYLGDPLKAKELAFNSLNQYETAKNKANATIAAAPLKGYALLTLGLCMQQAGAFPLALSWFAKIPNWRVFSVLLRLEVLYQVETCALALKKTTGKSMEKPLFSNLATKQHEQWMRYFSLAEQWTLFQYGLKAFGNGFTIVRESAKKPQSKRVMGGCSTGQFNLPKVCVLEAQTCFKKGGTHWKQGVRTLKRSLRKTPNEPLAWYELGVFYVQANHKTRAIEAFQQCVALLPTCSKAHIELGHLYHDLAQYIAATEAYVWAFLTTTETPVKRQVAYVFSVILERHAQKPSIQNLIPSLSVILALLLKQEQEPAFSTSGTSSHLAKLFQQMGWRDLAYWCCLQSLSVQETQPAQCVVNLAYMAAENDYLHEAVYYYKQSILANANDASLHNSLGQLYLEKLLLIETAKQEFEQAIGLDPASTTAHFNLGQVYGLQQQWTLAAQAFSKARALNEMSQELDVDDLEQRLHQLYENL